MKAKHIYTNLRKLQGKLKDNSKLSPDLYQNLEQSLSQRIEAVYFETLAEHKLYYTHIHLFLYINDKKQLPYQNFQVIFRPKIDNAVQNIPKSFETTFLKDEDSEFLKTILKLDEKCCFNPILIDYFSFSLIPSLYDMFIERINSIYTNNEKARNIQRNAKSCLFKN